MSFSHLITSHVVGFLESSDLFRHTTTDQCHLKLLRNSFLFKIQKARKEHHSHTKKKKPDNLQNSNFSRLHQSWSYKANKKTEFQTVTCPSPRGDRTHKLFHVWQSTGWRGSHHKSKYKENSWNFNKLVNAKCGVARDFRILESPRHKESL